MTNEEIINEIIDLSADNAVDLKASGMHNASDDLYKIAYLAFALRTILVGDGGEVAH